MRKTLLAIFSALLLLNGIVSLAQTPAPDHPPYWAMAVDPACPVSGFEGSPVSNKELRILYFPSAKRAMIKAPQQLTLQIAFEAPNFPQNNEEVPFIQKSDHWEAVVPLQGRLATYVIWIVRDNATNAVDDNGGKDWDLVFCSPTGQKSPGGSLNQARTYEGERWPFGIQRKKDYGRAAALLQAAAVIDPSFKSFFQSHIWTYEAKENGGTPEAYAKLIPDIEQALAMHGDDSRGMDVAIGNFVLENEKILPDDFVGRTLRTIDDRRPPGSEFSYLAETAYRKALRIPDPRKQLGAFDALINAYPGSAEAAMAQYERFQIFAHNKDLNNAEDAFAKYQDAVSHLTNFDNSNRFVDLPSMARLYIEMNTKLDKALALLDKAEARIQEIQGPGSAEIMKRQLAYIAGMRAQADLERKEYAKAIVDAKKGLEGSEKQAQPHFLLAQAYAGAGDKPKALDEYFEAALLPSNNDLKYREELQSYYERNFGGGKAFEATLNERIAERFRDEHYVPKLLDRPAPQLQFTTLKGESFDSAALSQKTVVVNFWSPG